MAERFDVVVIGAGPGGFRAARRCAQRGASVAMIERELMVDGFVMRYRTDSAIDGLPDREGAFLACSFWLADVYVLQNRRRDAELLFNRLVGLCNDLGLLSEGYDPVARRLVGNFPQAFSHVALVNTAYNLMRATTPLKQRSQRGASSRVRELG